MSSRSEKRALLRQYKARAAALEQEISVLTARVYASKQRSRPPSANAARSNSEDLYGFVAAQARANATSAEDAARIEDLIASTMTTHERSQAAIRKARTQHDQLIAEFGAAAVEAWKAEHADVAHDLLSQLQGL
mmetsp:Transcript_35521/g.93222  ORF Transcript_35521/g.93222 Transcript_35521/m.93222 type:complete len:134 (-) Transcript_35521:449-850(-)